MVDDTQARVMALIEPWNSRSLLTFRKKTLTPEMSLNLDMKLDPEDAAECLQNVFDAFGMDSDQVKFSLYYPRNPREAIPFTIGVLLESASARRWGYDWYVRRLRQFSALRRENLNALLFIRS